MDTESLAVKAVTLSDVDTGIDIQRFGVHILRKLFPKSPWTSFRKDYPVLASTYGDKVRPILNADEADVSKGLYHHVTQNLKLMQETHQFVSMKERVTEFFRLNPPKPDPIDSIMGGPGFWAEHEQAIRRVAKETLDKAIEQKYPEYFHIPFEDDLVAKINDHFIDQMARLREQEQIKQDRLTYLSNWGSTTVSITLNGKVYSGKMYDVYKRLREDGWYSADAEKAGLYNKNLNNSL